MAGERDSKQWISDFAAIRLEDRAAVGGKGASLGELTRAGIPVPRGFVITTAAFESFLTGLNRDAAIRGAVERLDASQLETIAGVSRQIRRHIEGAPLSEDLLAAIAAAYRKLGCGPVAVRSSATSEDSRDASFAGLQDTHLWVRNQQELICAVLACWSSLYSVESVSYRLRLKLPEHAIAMGVVVQQMVSSKASGVMFTRSPTTGDRSVIAIEGSWGLGSCIVSGDVTPDTFAVSKVTGEIVKRKISCKQVLHEPDLRAGGVRSVAVPIELQSAPCISDAQVAALAEIAKRIEQYYGCPQDIEWAIAGNEVFILQSRPETVWAARERQPLATPKAKPFDHVISLLGGRKD
jgi:pyruvate, water dikinase